MTIANQGDPIISMDGETIIAHWATTLDFRHGNSYTWTWFSPSNNRELIAGPKMLMTSDGKQEHANRITVVLEYARGPIQVWRVVEVHGGQEQEAFEAGGTFSKHRTDDDAVLARAIRTVINAASLRPALSAALHIRDALGRYAEMLEWEAGQ